MNSPYDARLIESRWGTAWERDGCYRAPDHPAGPKFFNYDSGPFPNGPLHMGHVRTYLFGDVTARYQRARGKSVLYCTEWDAFGLPNELAAVRLGQTPPEFTRRWIGTMSRQLRALGISYDFSRIPATCDPGYYGWTQWLFLKLLRRKLVIRKEKELPFCTGCETVLSRMQIERERCWRCGTAVERRTLPQWFVTMSAYVPRLLSGLDRLEHWSRTVRNLVRGYIYAREGRASAGSDWLISRQRSWGTPIPVVHCGSCGIVPVAETDLPVRLPDNLDWSLGPRALSSHRGFVRIRCPRCRRRARRETDTLDCFFDDIWCFLACLVDLDGPPSFRGDRIVSWMPVDCFHSGFDTVSYLHLHRFLGAALHDTGDLIAEEPIRRHVGNEMVLARGRKMSKHLGNAVSPSAIIRKHGTDTLRVAMLRAAAPHTAVDWRPEFVSRARSFLERVYRLYTLFVESGPATAGHPPHAGGRPSRAALALRRHAEMSVERIGKFVEDYRPNAAIDELESLFRQIESYVRPRLENARLSTVDGDLLGGILENACIPLGLFAPHLAEEVWHRLGRPPYVVLKRWPGSADAGTPPGTEGSSHSRPGSG